MDKIYLNTVYGLVLTGFLTLGGIFVSPFLLKDYFFPEQQESFYDFPDRQYDISFSYHNISVFPLPVNSLQVAYREFNSSYLNHSDPYLVAMWFFRNSKAHPEKEHYPDNCSTWRITPFAGRIYNEWNVCTTWATDNLPILVHNSYIAYEVMVFSQLILEATVNMPRLNFSTLGYEKNPETDMREHINGYLVPDKWVLSITLTFENSTSITIDAHVDGWLEYIRYEPTTWTPYGEGFTVSGSGTAQYMEFGTNFNDFHQAFHNYAITHIINIE
ncbi:MAG: hypothetical protein ACFFDC_20125 [Promethearchaeota archaeon]